MKKLGLLLLLTMSLPAMAAGNADAGKTKAVVCAACHGEKGISVNPEWPNLAGQHPGYLVKQLQAFKEGKTRQSAQMAGMVAGLSEQDMLDLAAYYAAQPRAEGETPEKFLHKGEQLYRGGDLDRKVSACIACHGPQGTGNAQANFPVLSGQHATYTIKQLQDFKAGARSNDMNAIMRDIAARMTPEEMEAVANYMQGLH